MPKELIPQKWYAGIMAELETKLVSARIMNTQYEGSVKYGSSVKIVSIDDPVVSDYVEDSDITYNKPLDTARILQINKKKYATIKEEDIDATQQGINLENKYIEKLGNSLRKKADSDFLAMYGEAGLSVTDSSFDSATVHSTMQSIHTKLSEKEVPLDERFLVITPRMYEKLVLGKIIRENTNNNVYKTGMVGEFLGFQTYMSNQIANNGSTLDYCLAGWIGESMAMAYQIETVERIRLEKAFAWAYRALIVYGMKVVRPDTLVVANLTYAADTAV